MSKNWKGGSTSAWRKLRAEILAHNQLPPPAGNSGRCTLGVVCGGKAPADQVHHILGRAITGDDRRYLAAVCGPCNRRVGDPLKSVDPPCRPVTRW